MEIGLENLYVDIGPERVKLEHMEPATLQCRIQTLEIRGDPVIQTLR